MKTLQWYKIWVRSIDGTLSIKYVEHYSPDRAYDRLSKILGDSFSIIKKGIAVEFNISRIKSYIEDSSVIHHN